MHRELSRISVENIDGGVADAVRESLQVNETEAFASQTSAVWPTNCRTRLYST